MKPFHGSADQTGREEEHRRDRRRGWFRRMDLVHNGRTFLRRRGVDLKLFGVYLHRIDSADPGKDLHDHPWPFVSIILRGGYVEEVCHLRVAHTYADHAEFMERVFTKSAPGTNGHSVRGFIRKHKRFSVHVMPLHRAHRIAHAEPNTITLVIRGRKCQKWGFYQPEGWVEQTAYDYEKRRPLTELR